MVINGYLGIEQLPTRAQHYVRTFLVLQIVSSFIFLLSNTFFVLYSIDRIGFSLTSLTLSFTFLVQLLFDYPSGSLGDWIGQRWVLIMSYVSFGIAFFLMSSAQSFNDFMIIAIFNGFGSAQISGTIATWLDNNYQKVIGDTDPDRKVYGFSRSRIVTMSRMASAASFMTGGFLATIMSRQFVFEIQAIIIIILIILAYTLVKDEKSDENSETDRSVKTQKSLNSFFKHLVGGIKFLVGSKAAFFFLIGSAFIFASIAIWGSLILFPLYFGYSGSDSLASVLRTTAFFVGIPISFYTAKISKRFTKDKLPLILFGFVLLFFPSFILLTSILPITNDLNIIGSIATILLLTAFLPTLFDLEETLRQRVMLDLVPSDYRNAVYSLIPTIISLLGIFLLPIAGTLIEGFGLAAGISLAFFVGIIAASMVTLGMYFHKKSTEEKTEITEVQSTVQTSTGP